MVRADRSGRCAPMLLLALSDDGRPLFVAEDDANAVAVFDFPRADGDTSLAL